MQKLNVDANAGKVTHKSRLRDKLQVKQKLSFISSWIPQSDGN